MLHAHEWVPQGVITSEVWLEYTVHNFCVPAFSARRWQNKYLRHAYEIIGTDYWLYRKMDEMTTPWKWRHLHSVKNLDHLCWIVFVILGSSYHTDVHPNIHYYEQLWLEMRYMREVYSQSTVESDLWLVRWAYGQELDITDCDSKSSSMWTSPARDGSADVWDIFASLLCTEL